MEERFLVSEMALGGTVQKKCREDTEVDSTIRTLVGFYSTVQASVNNVSVYETDVPSHYMIV
jgi:hypothetical protein